jgi:hypothetical protein
VGHGDQHFLLVAHREEAVAHQVEAIDVCADYFVTGWRAEAQAPVFRLEREEMGEEGAAVRPVEPQGERHDRIHRSLLIG